MPAIFAVFIYFITGHYILMLVGYLIEQQKQSPVHTFVDDTSIVGYIGTDTCDRSQGLEAAPA